MKKKVCFRVDGGQEIGLGHLVRCIACANMLKDDFEIHFVCNKITPNIKKEIGQLGFLFIQINNEDEFFALISGKEIVVLDHYGLDSQYQKKIKEKGCKLVCIDDLHAIHFYADAVINHAPGVSSAQYSAESYTKFYLGLEYALLRCEFFKLLRKEKKITKINNVLICFGGSDSNNITLNVLKAVLKTDKFKYISVIVGESYDHGNQLSEFLSDHLNVSYHYNLNAMQMLAIMQKCELAIVPSSTISIECCFAKMTILTGITAENQQDIHKGLKNLTFVKTIEDFRNIEFKILVKELVNIKKQFKEFTFPDIGVSPGSVLNIFKSLNHDKN